MQFATLKRKNRPDTGLELKQIKRAVAKSVAFYLWAGIIVFKTTAFWLEEHRLFLRDAVFEWLNIEQ
jgi:hypothetical protein